MTLVGGWGKNNIAFHLSRKYTQTVASVFCTTERSRKREWHAGKLALFEKIEPTSSLWP